MSAPPGWFADPWRIAPWRWWDGNQWTPYVWPADPMHHFAAVALADSRRKETTLLRWAKVGLSGSLVSAAGSWVNTFAIAHTLRSTFDQFNDNTNGQTFVFAQNQSGWWAFSYVFPTIALLVAIGFLMWQHSAATVARSLGYPARRSPDLGVASWFIPIVNFWFPYQALSDLLPPDHPMRPLCLRAWLAWLGTGVVNTIAFFLALASTGAAVVALLVGAVFVIYAFVTGLKLIDAVYLDHTRRLAAAQY